MFGSWPGFMFGKDKYDDWDGEVLMLRMLETLGV
jgi:hypothetical protein